MGFWQTPVKELKAICGHLQERVNLLSQELAVLKTSRSAAAPALEKLELLYRQYKVVREEEKRRQVQFAQLWVSNFTIIIALVTIIYTRSSSVSASQALWFVIPLFELLWGSFMLYVAFNNKLAISKLIAIERDYTVVARSAGLDAYALDWFSECRSSVQSSERFCLPKMVSIYLPLGVSIAGVIALSFYKIFVVFDPEACFISVVSFVVLLCAWIGVLYKDCEKKLASIQVKLGLKRGDSGGK